jgi:mono/diheme cytochrome c family protein
MRSEFVSRAACWLLGVALCLFVCLCAAVVPNQPSQVRAEAAAAASGWKAPARAAALKNPIPPDDASRATGKAFYSKECAGCHGAGGKGNGPDAADLSHPPSDLTTPTSRGQADGELFWKITEGRRPMPRFGRRLTDEQRWHVVNYLRSLSSRKKDPRDN